MKNNNNLNLRPSDQEFVIKEIESELNLKFDLLQYNSLENILNDVTINAFELGREQRSDKDYNEGYKEGKSDGYDDGLSEGESRTREIVYALKNIVENLSEKIDELL